MRRLTYANVVATLALFAALGGSAAAAVIVSSNDQIAPNTIYGANLPAGKNDNIVGGSIGSSDLANSAVINSKLAAGAVGSGKLADKAVIAGKLGDGAVAPSNLASGAVGTSKLADKAVTLPKLGTDVIDRIDSHTGTASQFTGTLQLNSSTILKTLVGIDVVATCNSGSITNTLGLQHANGTGGLQASGTAGLDDAVQSVNVTAAGAFANFAGTLNLDVVAENQSVGKFARIDVHLHRTASGCPYWGVTQVAS
jgi:hypothetical protein